MIIFFFIKKNPQLTITLKMCYRKIKMKDEINESRSDIPVSKLGKCFFFPLKHFMRLRKL